MHLQGIRLNPVLIPGLASFVLIGAAQALYGLMIPVVMRVDGLSQPVAALLVSAHWVGALAGVAIMIWRPALVSARLTLGLIAAGAALIAAGLAWAVTLSGAALLGAGYGAVAAIMNRRFLNEFGAQGPPMVGVLNAVFGVGAIGAPLLFLWLGNAVAPAFGVVAVTALAIMPLVGAEHFAAAVPSPGGGVLRRPGILILTALAIGFEACIIGLGPAALISGGISATRTAELTSLFFVAFMAARLSLLWIAPLFRPLTLLVLALAGCAASAAAAYLVDEGVFFVVAGAWAALLFPAVFVCAVARLGTDPRVAPMVIAAGLAGGTATPLLASAVALWLGGQPLFAIMAGYALCITVVAALSARRMMAQTPL